MGEEAGFLAAIQQSPADDTARLVYADWLDEQGDTTNAAKAEFIRLELRLPTIANNDKRERSTTELRLRKLAASLDVNWLAVVSHLDIENCGVRFSFVCPKKWEQLSPADSPSVRFCAECVREVHYCDTIMDARRHAWNGECVAVDLGVIRRDKDLDSFPTPRMGWAPYLASEIELMKSDEVSLAREEAKRKKQEA